MSNRLSMAQTCEIQALAATGQLNRAISRALGVDRGTVAKTLSQIQNQPPVEEDGVADTRLRGTTKRQVRQHFEEIERPALRALPVARFPFFHERRRSVNRDGHCEVANAACETAMSYGALRLRTIRKLLETSSEVKLQTEFDFLEEHPVIRPLSDYSRESLSPVQKGSSLMKSTL